MNEFTKKELVEFNKKFNWINEDQPIMSEDGKDEYELDNVKDWIKEHDKRLIAHMTEVIKVEQKVEFQREIYSLDVHVSLFALTLKHLKEKL